MVVWCRRVRLRRSFDEAPGQPIHDGLPPSSCHQNEPSAVRSPCGTGRTAERREPVRLAAAGDCELSRGVGRRRTRGVVRRRGLVVRVDCRHHSDRGEDHPPPSRRRSRGQTCAFRGPAPCRGGLPNPGAGPGPTGRRWGAGPPIPTVQPKGRHRSGHRVRRVGLRVGGPGDRDRVGGSGGNGVTAPAAVDGVPPRRTDSCPFGSKSCRSSSFF